MKLTELSVGDCAVIRAVQESDELARLKAMGVCLDRRIELVQRGDPLIFRVFGSRIGVSARLADHVEVERCDEAGRCWVNSPVLPPDSSTRLLSDSKSGSLGSNPAFNSNSKSAPTPDNDHA